MLERAEKRLERICGADISGWKTVVIIPIAVAVLFAGAYILNNITSCRRYDTDKKVIEQKVNPENELRNPGNTEANNQYSRDNRYNCTIQISLNTDF